MTPGGTWGMTWDQELSPGLHTRSLYVDTLYAKGNERNYFNEVVCGALSVPGIQTSKLRLKSWRTIFLRGGVAG